MIHVLRTRSPVYSSLRTFSLDLHVLGTPPAFVLSQDQTLQLSLSLFSPGDTNRRFRGSSCPRLFADVLRYSLRALRFRNLLRGLAIRFSKTERPCTCHSGRPTSSPASVRGRASYRCARFHVKGTTSALGHAPSCRGRVM